jgi:tetratricopeptide (TPR) repeat protein
MLQTKEEKYDELLKLLDLLRENRDWNKALIIGECLATIDPEDYFAYRVMGLASMELHDLDKSEEYFLKALEWGDPDSNTLLRIAMISSYRGDLNSEIYWIEKALEQDPDDPKVVYCLARAYMTRGENERAEELLQSILVTHPDHILSRIALADIYLLAQDLDKAEEQLREAITIQSDNPQLLHDLGYILKRKKNYKEALSLLFQALEFSPNKVEQYSEIGDAFIELGDSKNAISYLRKANELDPTHTLVCYNLGRAYFNLNRYESSIAVSKGALQHDPEMENGRTNHGLNATLYLGWAYLNSGKLQEAEQCFRKNLCLVASSYENLGRSLIRQEKYEEALQNSLRAVELDPENAMYWDLVGNAHLELNQLDEAQEMFEKAIDLNPDWSVGYYDLGVVFSMMKGRESAAMELFNHAIALNKEWPLPYYAIACLFALQNKKKSALNYLHKAILQGFKDRKHVDNDHDFDSLRDDKEFQEIIAKMVPSKQNRFCAEIEITGNAPIPEPDKLKQKRMKK